MESPAPHVGNGNDTSTQWWPTNDKSDADFAPGFNEKCCVMAFEWPMEKWKLNEKHKFIVNNRNEQQ